MGWLPYFTVFVVPTGATTGRRIVIDGINGQIVMYDANNNPVIVESSQTGALTFNGPNSSFSMMLGIVTDPVTLQPTPGFSFHSTTPPSLKDGAVTMGQSGGGGYIAFQPPRMSGDPVGTDITDVTMAYAQGDGGSVIQAEWFRGSGNLAGTTTFSTAPATWLTDGNMHTFASSEWPSFDIIVPPTGGLEISIWFLGHNAFGVGSSLAIGFQINVKAGGALVMAASTVFAALVTSPSAGFTSNLPGFATIAVGTDKLVNFVGQTVTVTPAYRTPNGSGTANIGVNSGRMNVKPAIYAVGFTG